MNEKATVHVIDDDAGIRKSLQMVLESASLHARTYDSAEKFLAADPNLDRPGCIVLDLRMRRIGGMELLQRLRSANVTMPILIISGHADVATAVRGMKLGAIDLLQKSFEPSALLEIVRKAIRDSAREHQKREELDGVRQRVASLTTRELELLKLLVAGRSNKQIAMDLDISIKTVANHRANLMAKTGALNAADLARLSTLAGIGPRDETRDR